MASESTYDGSEGRPLQGADVQAASQSHLISRALAHTAARDQRVLADLSHELGNIFHKLYYWAELMGRVAPDGEETAPEMLERTIRHLEEYLRTALEYFTPVEVSPTTMRAGDVVSSFSGHLSARLCGTSLDVRPVDESLAQRAILVDPGRISQAIELAVRHLGRLVGDDSRITVSLHHEVANGGHPCIELRTAVLRPVGDPGLFRTSEAGLEWALLGKLVRLHGGEVAEVEHVGERWFSILIPVSG